MSLPEKNNEKPLLKKHVNTIHCSNNLTLVQRKLFNALLFNAYYDLPEKSRYQIAVKKLCQLIGYDSRDYKKLRKSILNLITTAIEWNVIDREHGIQQDKWRASAIISAAKIEKGICTYEFSSVMRELLHAPEIYGKIDMKVMIDFKSSYGLALYENCIRFHGIKRTQWLSVDVFRKLMGIPDGYYQNFCDFKKRVLDIAVKEVNQHSPINISPEVRRVNKKVTKIRFKLLNKKDSEEVEKNKQVKNSALTNELVNLLRNQFNLSADTIMELSVKYDAEYIKKKAEMITHSESFKSGKIREMAPYLIDALKRDYQANQSSTQVVMHHQSMLLADALENKRIDEEKRRAANEKARNKLDEYLNNLTCAERDQLMNAFEKYLQQQHGFYIYKKFKENGIKNPAVKAILNAYATPMMEAK